MSREAYVVPEMLVWARETAGYSIESAVKKFNEKFLTDELLSKCEQGVKRLPYDAFLRLAKMYERPAAMFYFPNPPEEKTMQDIFTSLPKKYSLRLSPNMISLVKDALVKQIELKEDLVEKHFFKRKFVEKDFEKIFFQEMDFEKIKSEIEKLGITIVVKDFNELNYLGFYIYDRQFPIMFINESLSDERKVEVLVHELGHACLGESGICFNSLNKKAFSVGFLKKELFCENLVRKLLF